MPVYEALCDKCGKQQDYYQSVANCHVTPVCCGASSRKVLLTAPMGIVDIPAYVSPVSGKLIGSRSERREDFKRTNTREWEGLEQERKVAQERVKEESKKEDAAIESAVVSAWNQLPSEKRAVLESSL